MNNKEERYLTVHHGGMESGNEKQRQFSTNVIFCVQNIFCAYSVVKRALKMNVFPVCGHSQASYGLLSLLS